MNQIDQALNQLDVLDAVAFDWNIDTGAATVPKEMKMLDDKAYKRILKNDEAAYKQVKALEDLSSRPRPGEQWRLVTEKQFNTYALIQSILQNEEIDELYVATYHMNTPTAYSFEALIDSGRIAQAGLIISSFFLNAKQPRAWAQELYTYAQNHSDKLRIAYVFNHAKVCAAKTSGGDYIVFEGSGNLSQNGLIEQYVYENYKPTFEFHREWMLQVINDYEKTTRK